MIGSARRAPNRLRTAVLTRVIGLDRATEPLQP